MTVLISAVICTHNRGEYLKKAIQSLIDQGIPKEQYEIIIVDNCSDDNTKEIVEQFAKENNVRYIYDPDLGLCHARNTGWQNARGVYVAYLDDDAIADKNWLKNIFDTFLNHTEKLKAVGGKINLLWESSKPVWLSDELITALSTLDIAKTTHVLTHTQFLFGTNMAFRRSILVECSGFNRNLERRGKILLSNDEIYLQKKITEHGGLRVYNPEVEVNHHVTSSRLTKKWFIRRYYWQGISDSVMQLIEENPSGLKRVHYIAVKIIFLLRSPDYIWRLLIPANKPEEFTIKCYAYSKLGQISGLLRRV